MANFYATPTGAGDKDGSDWDNAFSYDEFKAYFGASAVAGDNYYFLSGTYTFSASFPATKQGDINNSINIIGVSDEALTPAVGDDRPVFSQGSYYFSVHRKNSISNIIFTSTYTYAVGLYTSRMYNCKVTCTGTRTIYIPYSGSVIESCELYNTNASGGCVYGQQAEVKYCYIKATKYGIYAQTTSSDCAYENIFDSCEIGIYYANDSYYTIVNKNTFYNCTTGIKLDYLTANGVYGFYNNIFHTCTTCFYTDSASTGAGRFEIRNNVFYNYTNITAGTGVVFPQTNSYTADPKLVNPSTGDFTLDSDSPYLNSALYNLFGRP